MLSGVKRNSCSSRKPTTCLHLGSADGLSNALLPYKTDHFHLQEGKVTEMKIVPLKKQSKKEQRKFHARSRRDWNGLKPTTRVVKSKKVYNRKKIQKPGMDE